MEVSRVANYRRESYSGVGSALMVEAVLHAMCWLLQKLGHEDAVTLSPEALVQTYITHAPPVAVRPCDAASSTRPGECDTMDTSDTATPKSADPTCTIHVLPAFEALPFYPRLGFYLQDPEAIILTEPSHPSKYAWVVDDLEKLNSMADHLDLPQSEFMQLLTGGEALDDDELYNLYQLQKHGQDLRTHAPKRGLTWPNPGVKERFSDGQGTSNDLELVELLFKIEDWNNCCWLPLGPLFIREQLQQFAQDNPNCTNWLDAELYKMPARVVLEREQQRCKERGPRKGISDKNTGLASGRELTMVLDAGEFLKVLGGWLKMES
jgi:hypothetical protein